MIRLTFHKILLTFAAALVLASVPKAVTARRGGGSHAGGGSHGGNSHGGAGFHGGGHSSFRGGGQSHRGSAGRATVSSARMGGGRVNRRQTSRGSYQGPGGFSPTMSGNFARSSTFGRGSFSSSANSRNFGYSRSSPQLARSSGNAIGGWNLPGNSAFRSTPGLARTSGSAMVGGLPSFGRSSGSVRQEMPRSYGSNVRAGGQWHSFGNSRDGSFARNVSGFSFAGASRENALGIHASGLGFGSNRFSSNRPAMSRFSSFSSFSGGRSMASFGSSRRFGSGDFSRSGFGNSGFGDLGFSNSLIGSSLSVIPNLLFGGLLQLGTTVFGGGGILEGGLLAGNAISLAARWLGSGLGSNGFSQGGSAGGDNSFGPGAFGVNFGFTPALAWPACNAVTSFQGSGWGSSRYCGPSPNYPLSRSGASQFGDYGINYNLANGHFGNSDFRP